MKSLVTTQIIEAFQRGGAICLRGVFVQNWIKAAVAGIARNLAASNVFAESLGTAGNTSLTTSRRALSTRWFGDDARFAERLWAISLPISGGLKPGDGLACETFPVVWFS